MPTLNISLPEQLKDGISEQVKAGKYASASDYKRDLIRSDKRQQEQEGFKGFKPTPGAFTQHTRRAIHFNER